MRIELSFSSLKQVLILLLLVSACSSEEVQTDEIYEYIELQDGRRLSYHTYGHPEGTPVFYFHGFPGSVMEVKLNNNDQTFEDLNIRLIAVNRPGYSDSDIKPERTLLDWPDDITELADSLGIDTFSVLGVSGGGPYAIVCAYKIPHRLHKVGVVSGMGPYNAPEVENGASAIILKLPAFFQKMMFNGMKKTIEKNPDKIIARMQKGFPEADREILDRLAEKEVLLNALYEGLKAGPEGAMQDAKIYKSDWGFSLNDVNKKIQLWHGDADLSVRIETGKFVAEHLANCEPTYYPGEGHFSILYNKANEIFSLFVTEQDQ